MEATTIPTTSSILDTVTLAKKGDREAFISLMESNKISMYRVAKSILHIECDIEDAMQNTIILAYEKINKLKKNDYFKTWLIRILINECNKVHKKNKKTISLEKVKEESTPSPQCINIDLYNALNNLDEKLRLVITLFYFEDMTTKEISKAIGISDNAVRTRLFRGREKLYKLLGGNS